MTQVPTPRKGIGPKVRYSWPAQPDCAQMPMTALTRDILVEHLQALQHSGGTDNRLVVASRAYYVVISSARGQTELTTEAVTNAYLAREVELSPPQREQLAARGFAARRDGNNVYRQTTVTGPEQLQAFAGATLDVLAAVYGIDIGAPATLTLQLGERDPTTNPDLLRLMRRLSVQRDWDARRAVYAGLLAATMLVPTDSESDSNEPAEVDRLGKFPVIAAFTDIDALRMWQPCGAPYRAMPVPELVPWAVARRVGSLLINPRGIVGGELYINELESLEGALQRRQSRV